MPRWKVIVRADRAQHGEEIVPVTLTLDVEAGDVNGAYAAAKAKANELGILYPLVTSIANVEPIRAMAVVGDGMPGGGIIMRDPLVPHTDPVTQPSIRMAVDAQQVKIIGCEVRMQACERHP